MSYFTKKTFDFLFDLDVNNNRAWFEDNRDRFEQHVREPMLAFIRDIEGPLHKKVSKHLVADARKQGGSMFRIHRDVRFSKDKSPYKTNVGAHFRHELAKDVHAPGVYLHLEPGNCFMGTGMWMPDTPSLTRIRDRIVDKPAEWKRVRNGKWLDEHGYTLQGEQLKRAPKGYDPEHDLIDDLRRKSFMVGVDLKDAEVKRKTFLDDFVERAAATKPLMRFLCRAQGVEF